MNNLVKLLDNGQFELFFQQILSAMTKMKDNDLAQILNSLYNVNIKYKLSTRPESRESFEKYVNIVSENLIVKMLEANQFNYEFVKLAVMLEESGIKLKDTQPYKAFTKKYEAFLEDARKRKDLRIVYFTLCALYVIKTFRGQGKSAKEAFIKKLFEINTDELLGAVHFNVVQQHFKVMFPDYREIFAIADANIFKGKFWSKDIISQKAAIYWITAVMWNIYGQEKGFLLVYETFKNLMYEGIKRDKEEFVFFVHFPLSHLYLNLADNDADIKKFNDEIEKPLSEYVRKVVDKEKIAPVNSLEPKPDGKVRVGFVYDRIVMNSPFKYLHSLLAFLITGGNGNFEYYVYDIECVQKSKSDPVCIDMVNKVGAKYYSNHGSDEMVKAGLYYEHKRKCEILREKIIEDKIDILVTGNNREQFNYILGTRTAPKQVFWTHGNFSYDVDGIDAKVCHWNNKEHPEYTNNFTGLLNGYLDPPVDEAAVQKIRSRWSEDTVILGSIGRLVKVNSQEYLRTVCDIMKECENTVYLVCGMGGTEEVKAFIKKENMEDRFFFEGMVDAHLYGHIIDVFLGTFPHSSGTAAKEARSKGVPTLALLDIPSACKNVDDYENNPFLALSNLDVYTDVAKKLIKEKDFRTNIKEKLKKLTEDYNEKLNQNCVEQWESFFNDLYNS